MDEDYRLPAVESKKKVRRGWEILDKVNTKQTCRRVYTIAELAVSVAGMFRRPMVTANQPPAY